MTNRLAKKILLLGLLLGLCGTLAAGEKGLLWRIQRPGEPVSHLFGTMHLGDPRALKILDRVRPVIDDSRQVVLEILPDAPAMFEVNRRMILPPDQNLSRIIGAELFEKVSAMAAGRGLPAFMVERFRPWAMAITLAMPENAGVAMDQLIYQDALDHGKKLIALETPAEQMALFETLPKRLQIKLLEQVVDDPQRMKRELKALLAAYLDRDLERLQRISRRETAGDDPELADWFKKRLIGDRNRRMFERLLPILRKGPTLVAVGALHLPGEGGLLQRLRDAGYSVEPVY